jgi:hypothetical protein
MIASMSEVVHGLGKSGANQVYGHLSPQGERNKLGRKWKSDVLGTLSFQLAELAQTVCQLARV